MTLSEKKTTLQVLRHLRRISLILLVLVSLAALILNLGRLSADDLGRLAARVRYGFSGKREEASSIVFTESEGKAVCVYKDGIAVAADGYLKVFDSSGLLLSQTLLSMENPALLSAKDTRGKKARSAHKLKFCGLNPLCRSEFQAGKNL